MKIQDKATEAVVGAETPDDKWLDEKQGHRVRNTHLGLLGLSQLSNCVVLDAGCGPGTYGIMLAQQGNKVIGIEISPGAVQVANERARKKGVEFSAQVGDLEKLPFPDDTFDVCFCGWVLHHFPDISTATTEILRVLKPGGRIAIVEPNESNPAMKLSRFVEDLPVLRKWILHEGWDTPNRTVTGHTRYIQALSHNGINDLNLSSCFPGGLSPIPLRSEKKFKNIFRGFLLNTLFYLRRIIFEIAYRLLPRPLNGTDLLITGTKHTPL